MSLSVRNRLAGQFERLAWESSRALAAGSRRFGAAGALALVLIAAAAAAGLVERWQLREMDALQARIVALEHADARAAAVPAASRTASANADGRARLRVFEDTLLPHEDIPVLLQDLLRIAEEEGVAMKRGEYRPEPDQAGGFLRYRMDLPVQGPAPAVHRFIQRALAAQRPLALRSVQFKRARIDADDIEARVQWVVLTRVAGAAPAPAAVASGEDR